MCGRDDCNSDAGGCGTVPAPSGDLVTTFPTTDRQMCSTPATASSLVRVVQHGGCSQVTRGNRSWEGAAARNHPRHAGERAVEPQ
ncbi:hypothetical protein UO65_5607 [Actinokineospora spheciospongiae]|uniref:Uncharacterized protein n=1 Tax=Actinokineospora spheciospongiae TaxID=909613 RepID=W7IRK2_9PSEU|nr:hypothetical protein UO65_5607 [Actinokineospora spheciospongiae]